MTRVKNSVQPENPAMGVEAQPQPQAQSAGQAWKGVVKGMEMYEGVKVKRLEWAEDLVYLSNPYCPYCGQRFKLSDEVIEVSTDPVFPIASDPEADRLVITMHLKCLVDTIGL